ncbi:DUF6281 family protein [Nocardioides mesophilus]|uniref:Uncharacterized protein n=1 Tax=Nocardioides mesophilus TaxID=433659 RepID=A0A7G9RDY0_9ACTN|nr:DUF6281 family protein [Nocardioides mesophilus]QNN53805.1 hypothetical protein H9L09_05200 [Nocardioides mesophilus]
MPETDRSTAEVEQLLRRRLHQAAATAPGFAPGAVLAQPPTPEPAGAPHGSRHGRGPGRRPRSRRLTVGLVGAGLVAASVAVAVPLLTGPPDPGGTGEAKCVALLDFAGHRYLGDGSLGEGAELRPGKVLGTGVHPGCDDGGGAAETYESTVRAVPGVDPGVAVLSDGQVWIDEEAKTAPEFLTRARQAVRCDLDAPLTLTGAWTGVEQRAKVRFDGDVRAPARITVVVQGPSPVVPPAFAAVTLPVRLPRGVDVPPADDVVAMLQRGAPLRLTVTCDGPAFVATALERVSG